MEIKEQISTELENLPPEILEQLYSFMQLVKKTYKTSQYNKNNKNHFLSKFAGVFNNESANEIKTCISSEF